jgi:hypothetical protein
VLDWELCTLGDPLAAVVTPAAASPIMASRPPPLKEPTSMATMRMGVIQILRVTWADLLERVGDLHNLSTRERQQGSDPVDQPWSTPSLFVPSPWGRSASRVRKCAAVASNHDKWSTSQLPWSIRAARHGPGRVAAAPTSSSACAPSRPRRVNCYGRAGSRAPAPTAATGRTLTVIVLGELASQRHLLAPGSKCEP